jgi:hypothetical protein
LQLHLDSASVESCVVFMPGNNRQRVARPFGRRFVNSEVTHAFTTGRLQYSAGNKPGYMWPLQAARFARIPGLFIPENQIGFSEDPAAFTNGKTSVGEHSTGAVHHRPFPKAALCFEAMLQPLRALAPADILFPHAALCLFGRKYLPSSTADCQRAQSPPVSLSSAAIKA